MWIARFALPAALVLSLLLASLAPRAAEPAPTITAKELLVRTQEASGRSFTYDQGTAAALGSVRVLRPQADSSLGELETALGSAGFRLTPMGSPEKALYRVQRTGV
jgi:hypothetical protein